MLSQSRPFGTWLARLACAVADVNDYAFLMWPSCEVDEKANLIWKIEEEKDVAVRRSVLRPMHGVRGVAGVSQSLTSSSSSWCEACCA